MRQKSEWLAIWLAALLMIGGLSAIYALISGEIRQQADALPTGVLTKLDDPLTDSDVEKGKSAGYQVEFLEQRGFYIIRNEAEKPVCISQVSDFTWNLFGRKIEFV